MIIRVVVERNCTEEAFVNVEDYKHLEELLKDNGTELWNLITEQEAEFKEVVGEILDTKYEDETGTEFYELNEEDLLISNKYE